MAIYNWQYFTSDCLIFWSDLVSSTMIYAKNLMTSLSCFHDFDYLPIASKTNVMPMREGFVLKQAIEI